jgi:hypothetical protein
MNATKAGDLVYVAKPQPCCGNASGVGFTFLVGNVFSEDTTCTGCGRDVLETVAYPKRAAVGYITSILKKIEPRTEPESITRGLETQS